MKGLAVLLVEDEALIRMMVADMLEESGHRVQAEASRIEAAVEIARTGSSDVAVLDVNVAGDRIDPIVDILKERDIPMVFATGYGREGVPSGANGSPVLRKPFTPDALEEALAAAVASVGD